jgi:hypothetical protein
LHEWGYRFNHSGKIQDLTTTQQRIIRLAESAEAYVQQEQMQRAQNGSNTKTDLENRSSKRKRIQRAKQGKDPNGI